MKKIYFLLVLSSAQYSICAPYNPIKKDTLGRLASRHGITVVRSDGKVLAAPPQNPIPSVVRKLNIINQRLKQQPPVRSASSQKRKPYASAT